MSSTKSNKARKADIDEVLAIIERLADFHLEKTPKKYRMSKLVNGNGFPYLEAI